MKKGRTNPSARNMADKVSLMVLLCFKKIPPFLSCCMQLLIHYTVKQDSLQEDTFLAPREEKFTVSNKKTSGLLRPDVLAPPTGIEPVTNP